MQFIENFVVILSIFAPMLCILVYLVKWKPLLKIEDKTLLFIIIQCSIIISAFALAPLEFPKISSYIEIYILFFAIFASLIYEITGELNFSEIYPIAGLMVFVAADVWEWGIFIFGSLGIFNPAFQAQSGQWFDQIHRIYALGVFLVLLKFTSWKPNRRSLSMLALTVAAPLVILAFSGFPGWALAVRGITLFLLGITIYLGVESNG